MSAQSVGRGEDMVSNTRVVVVGGGHNGLVAAGYLARAGLEVQVLERREKVGGAAITEEWFPGYSSRPARTSATCFRRRSSTTSSFAGTGSRCIPSSHPASTRSPTAGSSESGTTIGRPPTRSGAFRPTTPTPGSSGRTSGTVRPDSERILPHAAPNPGPALREVPSGGGGGAPGDAADRTSQRPDRALL